MRKIRCKLHPGAKMLPARRLDGGGTLFIYARCSSLTAVHRGKIDSINYQSGTGYITVQVSRKTRKHLFALQNVQGTKACRGLWVSFESGVTTTQTSEYVHAATNIHPI